MNIDSILAAIDSVDQDREQIAQGKVISITPAIGSHLDIEGSTGESKFSNFQNLIKSQVNLSKSFQDFF